MEKIFTLVPENRTSFYGKCFVKEDGNIATLYSYEKKIMEYDKELGSVKVTQYFNFSQTTKRHQKAFCKFYGITDEDVKGATEC